MNLVKDIEEITGKLKNPTLKEFLGAASDYILGLDFSQQEVRQAGLDCLRMIFNKIDNGDALNLLHMRVIYSIATKIAIEDYGLQDVKVRFLDVKDDPASSFAAAYYNNGRKDITFYNDSRHNLDVMTSNNDARTRLSVLTGDIIRVVFHELQHAIQDRRYVEIKDKKYEFTPNDYLMARSSLAVRLSDMVEEYNQGNFTQRVYGKNHSKFLVEIDANDVGERELNRLLDELNLECIERHTIHRFGEIREKQIEDLKNNLLEIKWEHKTNPNNEPVKANFKISFMLDTALKTRDKKGKEELIAEFPFLQLSYWPDGRRKTLIEVERERDTVKNDMLKTLSKEEIAEKVPNLIELYETVIESDPMLSMERALRQIIDLSWDSKRVFTPGDTKSRYSTKEAEKEILLLIAKVKDIIKYVEPADFYPLYEMVQRSSKGLDRVLHGTPAEAYLYSFKKTQFESLARELLADSAKGKGIKEEQREMAKRAKEKQEALDLLKKYFPDFEPKPMIFTGTLNHITLDQNKMEARMMNGVISTFVTVRRSLLEKNGDCDKMLGILRKIYDFDYKDIDEAVYREALKNGTLKVPENIYQKEARLKEEARKERELTSEEKKELEGKGKVDLRMNEPEKKSESEEVEYDEYGVPIPKDGENGDGFGKREITRTFSNGAEEDEDAHKRNYGIERF